MKKRQCLRQLKQKMPRPLLKTFQKKENLSSMEELKMKICLPRNFAITVIVTGTLPGNGQMNQKGFMINETLMLYLTLL